MIELPEQQIRQRAKEDGITHLSTGIAIVRAGKILVVRRAAHEYLGGYYELPGGGVDDGETIEQAAIREVKEETGLEAKKIEGTFDGFDYSTDKKPKVRQINCLVSVDDGNVKLDPKEHDQFIWIDSAYNLSNLKMSDIMRSCITDALDQVSAQKHPV